MTEPAAAQAAADRRAAVDALRIAELVAATARGRLSNGLGPVEAARMVSSAATDLARVSLMLRRIITGGDTAAGDRPGRAREMESAGLTRRQIAEALEVSPRTVRGWLQPRPGGSSGRESPAS